MNPITFARICVLVGAGALTALIMAQEIPPTTGIAFPVLGKIAPRHAKEIASSNWSVGGETLDRDFAVYAKYKDYLGPLGAKAIRLQAGWAKTEKTTGVYDWAWLDAIVDDARAQGVQPWLELSYGNTIYPGGGGTGLGGGFPRSAEGLAAWDRWVRATVRHFMGRVQEWEVWNEPDGGRENTPEDYAALFVRTAEIIRHEQPTGRIYALALAYRAEFAEAFISALHARGKLDLVDAITFHGYPPNPDDTSLAARLREIIAKYGTAIDIREGENGAPSMTGGYGALKEYSWSELTQAKWDLRRLLAHRSMDVPTNLFTLMELQYPTGLNSKGLLKANPDQTVAYAKPAYFAAQNVYSVFDDSLQRIADFPFTTSTQKTVAVSGYAKRDARSQVIAIWLSGAPPLESNATTLVDFTFARGEFNDPVYVDLRTGGVYRVPTTNWSRNAEGTVFRRIPVYDSPVLIAESSAIRFK